MGCLYTYFLLRSTVAIYIYDAFITRNTYAAKSYNGPGDSVSDYHIKFNFINTCMDECIACYIHTMPLGVQYCWLSAI